MITTQKQSFSERRGHEASLHPTTLKQATFNTQLNKSRPNNTQTSILQYSTKQASTQQHSNNTGPDSLSHGPLLYYSERSRSTAPPAFNRTLERVELTQASINPPLQATFKQAALNYSIKRSINSEFPQGVDEHHPHVNKHNYMGCMLFANYFPPE